MENNFESKKTVVLEGLAHEFNELESKVEAFKLFIAVEGLEEEFLKHLKLDEELGRELTLGESVLIDEYLEEMKQLK